MTATSYFAKYHGPDAVSIALWKPRWYVECEVYPALYPTASILRQYKNDHDIARYTSAYSQEVLDRLDPVEVYRDLQHKVILCYETGASFCHRHLVSYWLMTHLGVEINEL